MPHGSGALLRQALLRASPWQRCVIAGAMVAGGVALALLGQVAGGILAVAGVLLLWRMIRDQLRRGDGTHERVPGAGRT